MGQWDNLKSGSVMKGIRKGLADDLKLSHSEVVDIIRATLSDGIVNGSELDDLMYVSNTSRTISPRSKALMQAFATQVRSTVSGKGPFSLPTEKHKFAADMVCNFLQRTGRTSFPMLDRDEIGVGLLMRIANPGIIRQGSSSLCGPSSLLYNLATDKPGIYAKYAIDLYELGKASIGRLRIEPGSDVRGYKPPAGAMHPVDWMTTASLRDSENWFFDYDSVDGEFSGITMPGELADWFRRAGYSDVRNETNVYFNKGTGNLDDASKLFADGYRVCLFINAHILEADEQTKSSTTPDHWVVLRSEIDHTGGKVTLKVFTWGKGDYQVPQGGDLSLSNFLGNFYGYVAAKT
jgi:hypothetical protein